MRRRYESGVTEAVDDIGEMLYLMNIKMNEQKAASLQEMSEESGGRGGRGFSYQATGKHVWVGSSHTSAYSDAQARTWQAFSCKYAQTYIHEGIHARAHTYWHKLKIIHIAI